MPADPQRTHVWTWLPGAAEPVVAGRLDDVGERLAFTYDDRYLARGDAVALAPQLPLSDRQLVPQAGVAHGAIADAAPDAWGRRVILNVLRGTQAQDTTELRLADYLLHSGSDRIGALDFQTSADVYVARRADHGDLAALARTVQRVEGRVALNELTDAAMIWGGAVGGARPKALVRCDGRPLVAKFVVATDPYPVVQAEFVTMRLARLAGLRVADVALAEAAGEPVLLVERFDRTADGGRRAMISALTALDLDEVEARYATYTELAELIASSFTDPQQTLRELFARITFNILVGNNDDHARNHAAFWDGRKLTLTPAYDICPQPRSGGEAKQIMAIGTDGWRYSQVAGCVQRAGVYGLSAAQAREIVDHQIATIESHWDDVCDRARLSCAQREQLWGRQILNPYAVEGYAA